MPREITHWTIAELVYRSMPDGILKQVLKEHAPLYYTGSVIPDSPYCSPAGLLTRHFYQEARRIHGLDRSNNWKPFQRLFSISKNSDGYRAITAGAITHLMADAVFHPFVYYYTGKSTVKHFILETVMDHMISGGDFPQPVENFVELVKFNSGEWETLSEWTACFFGSEYRSRGVVCEFLNRHAELQCKIKQLEPLVLLKGQYYRNLLSFPFIFKHPVTGQSREGSFDSLLYKAVSKSLGILSGWELSVKEGWEDRFFSGLEPVSPLTGIHPEYGIETRYLLSGERLAR